GRVFGRPSRECIVARERQSPRSSATADRTPVPLAPQRAPLRSARNSAPGEEKTGPEAGRVGEEERGGGGGGGARRPEGRRGARARSFPRDGTFARRTSEYRALSLSLIRSGGHPTRGDEDGHHGSSWAEAEAKAAPKAL